MSSAKFISLNNITVRIRDKFLFKNTSLQLQKADNLLVVGANGSGKTTFVKAIAGLLPVAQGEIILEFLEDPLPYPSVHKNKISFISFDSHKKIHLENELKKDLSEFTGKKFKTLNLSTGQTRKLIIKKALEKNPSILILDEPFDGLDKDLRKDVKLLIEGLVEKVFVILVTHRSDEVIKGIKKAVLIRDGKIKRIGIVKEVLEEYRLFGSERSKNADSAANKQVSKNAKILIDFKNVSVEFDSKKILNNINWQVREGENWAILGPNGAGKSTLVKLITGENLQVFANQIKIFGKTRNVLDIAEINKKISVVSTDQSLRIHDYLKVSKIVDNVSLIKKLGLQDLINKTYGELSFGQKRLVLIARALNNSPHILILDEPCHGLDSRNRKLVLEEVEKIARNGTTIIFITHHQEEIIPATQKVMYLRSGNVEKISEMR